jgi:hypothetical protein
VTKVLVDKEGFPYGWNYEMAKLTDLYQEVDLEALPRVQAMLRQPKRTLGQTELHALGAVGNTQGHYPEDANQPVVLQPSGLQMDAAVAARRAASLPTTVAMLPDEGPPTFQDPVPTPPPPTPVQAAPPVQLAGQPLPDGGPKRSTVVKRRPVGA